MHGADGAGVSVSPLIAHYADRHHRQQDRERLPDFLIQASFLDLAYNNLIAFAQQFGAFFGHFPQNPNRQPWPGERLPLQNFLGHAEIAADAADLIFE